MTRAALLAAAAALFAVAGTSCLGDKHVDPHPCPGMMICSDGQCHQCCDDGDCGADEVCATGYICLNDEPGEGEPCESRGECWDGFKCDPLVGLCLSPCSTDGDCVEYHTDVPYNADLVCTDGVCDFVHCQRDADCDGITVCYSGDCVTPTCALDATCSIIPGDVVLAPGVGVELTVWPLLSSGSLAPGREFEWASSDESVAAVDGPRVTGGAVAGTATVTATDHACGIECSLQVRNLGPVVDVARVLVVDGATGEALAGIGVGIDGVGEADTDAGGVAVFAGADLAATPAAVTVAAGDVGYVSIVGADSNDLLVPVPLAPSPPRAGGVRGTFDFDQLRCEPGEPCEIKLGMAGLSSPGWPLDWTFTDLLGEPVMMHVQLGGADENIAYPSGTALGLNDTFFREEFAAAGERGQRVVWGIGLKTNLADLTEVLGSVIQGSAPDDDVFWGLGFVLALFNDMGSALGPLRQIGAVDRVTDEGDLDGDGSLVDLVPDYEAFEQLPSPLPLKVPCQRMLSVQVPELPRDQAGGHVYTGVLVMAGALVEGSGLVVLGLALGPDVPIGLGEPDGFVDDIELPYADVAGRLPAHSYRLVVLALALDGSQLSPNADPEEPFLISGQAHFFDAFPETLSLRPFSHPPVFQHDPDAREVDIQELGDGADAMVVLGRGEGNPGDWKIFAPAALGPLALPPAPAAGDRQDRVGLAALWLADGVDLSDLAAFSDTNLDDLAGAVTDFAIAYPAGHPPLIGCATQGAGAGGLIWGLCLLGGVWLIARRRRRWA